MGAIVQQRQDQVQQRGGRKDIRIRWDESGNTKLENRESEFTRLEKHPDEHWEYNDYVTKHGNPMDNTLGHRIETIDGVYGVTIPGKNVRLIVKGKQVSSDLVTKAAGNSCVLLDAGQLADQQRDYASFHWQTLLDGAQPQQACRGTPNAASVTAQPAPSNAAGAAPPKAAQPAAAQPAAATPNKASTNAKGKAEAKGRGRPPKDVLIKVVGAVEEFRSYRIGSGKYIGDEYKTHKRLLNQLKTDVEAAMDHADADPLAQHQMTAEEVKSQTHRFLELSCGSKRLSVINDLRKAYKDEPTSSFMEIYDTQCHYLGLEPHVIKVSDLVPACFIELRQKHALADAPAYLFWSSLSTPTLMRSGAQDCGAFQSEVISDKIVFLQGGDVKQSFAECMGQWFNTSHCDSNASELQPNIRKQVDALLTFIKMSRLVDESMQPGRGA